MAQKDVQSTAIFIKIDIKKQLQIIEWLWLKKIYNNKQFFTTTKTYVTLVEQGHVLVAGKGSGGGFSQLTCNLTPKCSKL